MFNNHSGTDLNAVPHAPAERAKEQATHETIEHYLAAAKTGEQSKQVGSAVILFQRGSKLQFPARVRTHAFASEDRSDFLCCDYFVLERQLIGHGIRSSNSDAFCCSPAREATVVFQGE